MGNEQGRSLDTTTPEGVKAMDENLQRKFAKGIQYNMKVVVRGDRNTGKSCLLYRMQGKNFSESYLPTNEIQVGHILWTYPGTSDTVKVEIWDTVDKGKPQKSGKGLKIFNSKEEEESPTVLDAEFLDVYQGAHAVVFVYDILKIWTWQYIERQLPHVPLHIPILVLGNFSDMNEHRTKSYEDAEFYVTHLNRPDGAAEIRYAECSMKNGFGLRFLHKFLSIPFLHMQQESLLHQLKTNREQILVIHEELDGFQSSTSYDQFEQQMANVAPPPSSVPPQSSDKPLPGSNINSKSSPVIDPSKGFESTDGSTPEESSSTKGKKMVSKLSGFMSKTKESPQQKKQMTPKSTTSKSQKSKVKEDVDDFIPEGELDDQFFNDDSEEDDHGRQQRHNGGDNLDSDDEDDQNPQVAMDEDLSSVDEEEDDVPVRNTTSTKEHIPVATTMEQDEEEEEEEQEEEQEEQEEEEDEQEEEQEEDSEPEDQFRQIVHEPEILKPTIVQAISVDSPSSKPNPKVEKVPPKKKDKVVLRSVQDVVLTESEEDEEVNEEAVQREETRVVKPKEPKKEKKPKTTRKESNNGLLLAFNETPPSKPKKKSSDNELISEDSPSERRKKDRRSSDASKKHHKKHKKKSKTDKESKESVPAEEGERSIEDPFGFTTSLDAWLGSGEEVQSPKQSRSSISKKISQSIMEDDYSDERPKKHSKDGTKKKKKSKRESGSNFNELL